MSVETMREAAAERARVELRELESERRASVTYNGVDIVDHPVEIAEGRGDLRFTSMPFELWPYYSPGLVGGRPVSFAGLFSSQPWIAAAVMRMLTWAARVPLKCYRATAAEGRARVLPGEHRVADAIVSPWEAGAQVELVMALLGPMLVHGNAIVSVDEGRSGRIQFEPLDWRAAIPIMPASSTISGWRYVEDGEESTYSADATVHVHWWSPTGPVGISPLQQLGTTISTEDAAQRYQRALFANGARPPSAITMPDGVVLDEAIRSEIRADLDAIYAGPENAGRPALLPGGLKWEGVAHTAHEAELIDQRRIAREEVAAVYLIPPPMLGILDRATYSNIETQREMSYTDAVGPPLILIEQLLNAQLVRGLLKEPEVFVEFDFGPVLRGDRLKEIQALREGVGSGIYKPNEARHALNLERVDADGADSLWMPQNNLAPLGAPAPVLPEQSPTETEEP